jgi:GT2 family glycosyltransferase
MKNLKRVTAVILTYKTPKKIIFNCLKSIDKKINISIIENSKKFEHKNFIKKKFPKVKFYCTGENLGYGKGNNFGLIKTKTDFALILNPDVICEKNFFKNLSQVLKKNTNFDIIGCQYSKDKIFMPAGFFEAKKNESFKKKYLDNMPEKLMKVEWVTGCSMLINLKKFKNKNIFDKRYFLYFEEFDLCKNIIKNGGSIYTSKKLRVNHLGFQSSMGKNQIEKVNANNIKNWHWMWSWFYFYKKNYSFFHAFFKLTGKLIKSFIKSIFYFLTLQENKKNKYLYRFLGLLNSMIGKPAFYRGKKSI